MFQLTDKAGLLMREYCKCSVYDRMSTRPFLTTLEKQWITFQVLYALHRMHKLGICHGDIKVSATFNLWLFCLHFNKNNILLHTCEVETLVALRCQCVCNNQSGARSVIEWVPTGMISLVILCFGRRGNP